MKIRVYKRSATEMDAQAIIKALTAMVAVLFPSPPGAGRLFMMIRAFSIKGQSPRLNSQYLELQRLHKALVHTLYNCLYRFDNKMPHPQSRCPSLAVERWSTYPTEGFSTKQLYSYYF